MYVTVALVAVYLTGLLLLAWPLGRYLADVFFSEKVAGDSLFSPVEKLIYRLSGINAAQEMNWRKYAAALLAFNVFGLLLVYLIQVKQDLLPFNPNGLAGVYPWYLAFNTAVSFMTNTNWQAYAGERTMSYFTQMLALTVQNFLSAATGLSVAMVLIRGLIRKQTDQLGNFWVDMVRGSVRVLLPMSLIFSLILVQQGVLQNFSPYVTAHTLEGTEQILAMGPVASQEAIKILGVNGGGFFNANSAHPFENPTPFSNFLQMLGIFLLPASVVFAFGRMAKERRQGFAILTAMLLLFLLHLGIVFAGEFYGNPLLAAAGVADPSAMEGKEVRFGIADSSLFAAITTAASCGAVNAMHDSFTPLGGLALLLQIMLGEVVVGGVGAGFYGMMVFVILTVFIVGLMVGRTPEYLGKKIEAREMKMATLAVLIPAVTILAGSAVAVATSLGVSSVANPGPHGLSEILYAFSSSAGNNGSAFAGLNANTTFYNLMLAAAMLIGRFGVILPVLAIAGSLAEKKISPPGPGTFPTHGCLFAVLLAGVVMIVGALTFMPALALGPVVEHLQMIHGITY